MDPNNLKIPKIASGAWLPPGVEAYLAKKDAEQRARKQQLRHDWLIAIFGIFGGAVSGFLSSLLFWLITK